MNEPVIQFWGMHVEELYDHYVKDHQTSPLQHACRGFSESSGFVPEVTLKRETHYFLEGKGFKWDRDKKHFEGVNNQTYQNAERVVDSALRKYADYCKNHF